MIGFDSGYDGLGSGGLDYHTGFWHFRNGYTWLNFFENLFFFVQEILTLHKFVV